MSYTKREFFENKYAKDLGFDNFKHYMRSDLLKEVRRRILKLKGRKCKYCGKTTNQIYFKFITPEKMLGNEVSQVEPMCCRCIKKIIKNEKPVKLTLAKKQKPSKMALEAKRDRKFHDEQAKKWQ